MKVINLAETNSILNQFIAELRDVNVQNDRMRFRRNIERIGELMAYEISKTLDYSTKKYKLRWELLRQIRRMTRLL